jgi:hypothetical protein
MPGGTAARFISAVFGAIIAIIGVGGVPLAILAGNWTRLVLFTIMLFAGIGILGWAYKE